MRFRAISVGMAAYAEELATRLPRVAPDLNFAVVPRANALDLREQVAVPRALRAVRPQLVHHLTLYAPIFGPRPSIVTVHDLIHLRYPELFKRTVGPYYATVVRAVCARAARVITDDERTIGDLERYLGVPPQKVAVIALGANDAYRDAARPFDNPHPYFLNVGNHRPHKDLATLFAAWAALDPARPVDLILTGSRGSDTPAVPSRVRGSLRFVGDVSVAELRALYRGAVALVHPALCEGFGLPMLEAATVGTPVLASQEAVPSVLRSYASVFPARDVRALGILMHRSLDADQANAADPSFARSLTWDRCAAQTAEVYRTVLRETGAG